MRCPLCKEVVEDKESLQVHYITSCKGYRSEEAALESSGQTHTSWNSGKCKVRFLWKKCLSIVDLSVFLFSTFDQVTLKWEESLNLYQSDLVEVKPGTYKDCQLVVGGDLYPTEAIVIQGSNKTVQVAISSGTSSGVDGTQESLHWSSTGTGSRDLQRQDSLVSRSHRYVQRPSLESSFSRMSDSTNDTSVRHSHMEASVAMTESRRSYSGNLGTQPLKPDSCQYSTAQLRQENDSLNRDKLKLCQQNEELVSQCRLLEHQLFQAQRQLDEVSADNKNLQTEVRCYREEFVQLKQSRDTALKRADAAELNVHRLATEIQQKEQEVHELSQMFYRQQEDLLKPEKKQKTSILIETGASSSAGGQGNVSRTNRSKEAIEIDHLNSDLQSLRRAYRELEQQYKKFLVPLDIAAEAVTIPKPAQRLGGGSYGDVFVGLFYGVEVAVKNFHKLIMKGHTRDLCVQELSVCQQVRHPNIVFYYGAVMVKDTPLMLLMERLEGSLQDLIEAADRDKEGFTYREMIDLAADTAAGIAHLHEQEPLPYIHGDIRSNNVLVTKDMRAKVGDLGTTHVVGSTLTAGPVSHDYLASERMSREGDPAPSRSSIHSDIYSLGATLADIFAGKLVSREQRLRQIYGIQVRTLRSLCHNLVQDNAEKRPSARRVFEVCNRHKSEFEYTSCVGKRVVFRVGDQLTMINVQAQV